MRKKDKRSRRRTCTTSSYTAIRGGRISADSRQQHHISHASIFGCLRKLGWQHHIHAKQLVFSRLPSSPCPFFRTQNPKNECTDITKHASLLEQYLGRLANAQGHKGHIGSLKQPFNVWTVQLVLFFLKKKENKNEPKIERGKCQNANSGK